MDRTESPAAAPIDTPAALSSSGGVAAWPSDLTREVSTEIAADVRAIKARLEAHGAACHQELTDTLKSADWHSPNQIRIGHVEILTCGCIATLKDTSDPWSKCAHWDLDDEACGALNGRGDVVFSWQSTPRLFVAHRKDYCGCGTCNPAHGYGKTRLIALRSLADEELLREEGA